MAVVSSVQELLRRANVPYTVLPHRRAYTAQEEAAVTHIPGRYWAKVVACFIDGEPIQAVVPADLEVDLDRLAVVAGATSIRLADEGELRVAVSRLRARCDAAVGPALQTARLRR